MEKKQGQPDIHSSSMRPEHGLAFETDYSADFTKITIHVIIKE